MTRRKIRLLAALARADAGYYVGALLATITVVFVGLLTPWLLAGAIDSVFNNLPLDAPGFLARLFERVGGRGFFAAHLWVVALLLVALAALNALAMFLKGKWSAIASENIARDLRDRVYAHLQHLPYDYHVKAETGDLIQRCTSDVETVRRFLATQLLEIVSSLATIVLATLILWRRSPTLTLISFTLIPVLFIGALVYSKKIMAGFQIYDEAEGKLSATLQESLAGVRVVRAFGRQQHEIEKFDAASVDLRAKAMRVFRLLAWFWSISDALSMLQTVVTLLVGIAFAARGRISVGTLTLFVGYMDLLIHPARQLGRLLSDGGKALISIERIDQILRQPAEADAPDSVAPASLRGDIVFEDVCFAYEAGHPILDHVSFTVPQGTTLAILGGTGSGKSTLVQLLQRLYEPQSGRITIGGAPLNKIRKKALRARVGLVLQEPFLYSKTLRENVGIVAPDAPESTVTAAAAIAHADAFIRASEQGYDTLVGERGVTLSGGQKQRVAIARALIRDHDILIFDDSLSAVDTQTDAAIRAALRERRRGTTTLIISHRIATLSEADHILVLENGRVAQFGTHAELVSRPGLYRRIHSIQNALEDELQQTLGDAAPAPEGGTSVASL
jgi:ATP-binding cassette subfamily B protein